MPDFNPFILIPVAFVLSTILGGVYLFIDAWRRFNPSQAFSWAMGYSVTFLFFGIGHYLFLLYWFISRPKLPKRLMQELTELLPGAPAKFRHCFWDTGIIIDPTAKKLAMISQGVKRVYDFKDIRNYAWNIQQDGQERHVHMLDIHATRANRRTNASNKANTGLFLVVADIHRPNWQILFHRKSDLHRWYEILNQAFEGHLT
jgi:Domain of unknown function (DUF4755)